MNSLDMSSLRCGLAQLDDAWVEYSEHSAFVCEAACRLLQDHPNLALEVIQGAESQARQLRRLGHKHSQQLVDLRAALDQVEEAAVKT